MKKCPFCVATITDEALRCIHCGEWVEKMPTLDNPPPGPRPSRLAAITLSWPSLVVILHSLLVTLWWMFLAAVLAGFFTRLGLRNPTIGLAMLVFIAVGLVAVSGIWLDPAPGAKPPLAHTAAMAIPLAVYIPGLLAVIFVGPIACLGEDWSRLPLWARILAIMWVSLAMCAGITVGLLRRSTQKLLFRRKVGDAAFMAIILGILATYALAVVVTLVYIASDSEDYRARILSLDQPTIVWVMLALGAFGGLAIRLGYQASQGRAKV